MQIAGLTKVESTLIDHTKIIAECKHNTSVYVHVMVNKKGKRHKQNLDLLIEASLEEIKNTNCLQNYKEYRSL